MKNYLSFVLEVGPPCSRSSLSPRPAAIQAAAAELCHSNFQCLCGTQRWMEELGLSLQWALAQGVRLSCARPAQCWALVLCRGLRGGLSTTVWQQMLLLGQKSERGQGREHTGVIFLPLCQCFSELRSNRKCEGKAVMDYVSGARGFGLFCGRLH
uniref:Uncharacterized protein n=1 Tax=Knipowitschia caucasica TaxID=637954 RepID=A0AAV2L0V3_KNICA